MSRFLFKHDESEQYLRHHPCVRDIVNKILLTTCKNSVRGSLARNDYHGSNNAGIGLKEKHMIAVEFQCMLNSENHLMNIVCSLVYNSVL